MTPPTNIHNFIADWQRREDEARKDPHHAKDHEYAAWLVANAANIRAVVQGQSEQLAAVLAVNSHDGMSIGGIWPRLMPPTPRSSGWWRG